MGKCQLKNTRLKLLGGLLKPKVISTNSRTSNIIWTISYLSRHKINCLLFHKYQLLSKKHTKLPLNHAARAEPAIQIPDVNNENIHTHPDRRNVSCQCHYTRHRLPYSVKSKTPVQGPQCVNTITLPLILRTVRNY